MRIHKIIILAAFLSLTGCATVPMVTMPPKPPEGMPGIYHRVEKSQTLWRISKIYDVDLTELAEINHIQDTTSIETGQLVFIPRRQKPQALYTETNGEDFIWPLKGTVVSVFGQTLNSAVNKGINIRPLFDADVVAARSGKIIFYSPDFEGFGKTIIIDHGDGFSTVYSRNAQVFIRPGDAVQKGTIIAKAGSAGRDKNTYLHFEIRKGYISQNPYFYLPR